MLTENELKVLSHIRKNARKSVSKISAETNLAPSTVFNKLRKLEMCVVKKYTTLIDFQKLGYNIIINFAVKSSGSANEREVLKDYLMGHSSVNSLYSTGMDYDFYIEAVFSDLKSLYDFIDELSAFKLKKIDEHHIIEEIRREDFLIWCNP